MTVKVDHSSCRRIALQIAAQLPDDPAASFVILDYCRELVEWPQGGGRSKPIILNMRRPPTDIA